MVECERRASGRSRNLRVVPDVGGFFDRLTRRGKGGRRLAEPTPSSGSGGVRGRLKDVVDKARNRSPKPKTAAVTIEYSPRIDGDPDPGEVVWTWVPFEEDPTQGKDRPVVIIGRRNGNLVGIPLTTKRDDREPQVSVGTGTWDSERRTSYARIWRLLDVDEAKMRREGAILDRARFDAVIDAVDDHYDVVPLTTPDD